MQRRTLPGVPTLCPRRGSSGRLNCVGGTFDGRLDANTVTFDELVLTAKTVGGQLSFVLSGLLAAMAVFVIFKMKGNGFRRSFTLSGGGGPSFIEIGRGSCRDRVCQYV